MQRNGHSNIASLNSQTHTQSKHTKLKQDVHGRWRHASTLCTAYIFSFQIKNSSYMRACHGYTVHTRTGSSCLLLPLVILYPTNSTAYFIISYSYGVWVGYNTLIACFAWTLLFVSGKDKIIYNFIFISHIGGYATSRLVCVGVYDWSIHSRNTLQL